jgi:hypothetical protein
VKVPHFARLDETGFDRIVWTFAVFVLIGPPAGLIVLVTGFALREGSTQALAGLPATLPKLIEALPFAYVFGILPAAAASLLVGVCKVAKGYVPWWVAFAIGTIIGFVFLYFGDRPRSPSPPPSPTDLRYGLILILVNLLPTMLCWLIVRNWYTTPAQSSDA